MPDDKRLDLSADLDAVTGDFLNDVKAATEDAKKRKASDAAADRRNVVKEKDRKISAIIIAAAVVVLLAIAYWAVFARQPDTVTNAPVVSPQKVNAPISTRVTPQAPLPMTPPAPARNNAHQAEQQPYESDPPGQ